MCDRIPGSWQSIKIKCLTQFCFILKSVEDLVLLEQNWMRSSWLFDEKNIYF